MHKRAPAFTCLVLAGTALLLSSCGGYVARGRHLYGEGRYIESAEVLARYEREVGQEPPKRRAEYATYRGLTSLVLGNYPDAHRWMAYAYEVLRYHPTALRPEYRRELDRGWFELSARMAGPPPFPVAPRGPEL